MKRHRQKFIIFFLFHLLISHLLSTQLLSMKIVGKKKELKTEYRRKKKERSEEEIKNQQTTNNIILTSRAIFRALKASSISRRNKEKNPKHVFQDNTTQLFGVRKPQTEQYLKGLNEGL